MLYNFAADCFNIMKLCSRLFVLIVEVVQNTTPLGTFDPHFEEVGGSVESWLMARWKARVRLPVRRD